MTKPIVLQDAFKKVTHDQDKILKPQETVKRFKERLKEIDLDILQETKRIDNGRLDIPVFFSKCGVDAIKMTGTRKQMGKGGTVEQAEASAVMELAERFSFFSFSKNPANFKVATYTEVEDQALPFEMIAKSVHDESDDLPAAREIFAQLPLKWTRAYNLTRQQEVLIPFDWFFAINEFNGPSAGNCVEEALSQGICEIVERHVSSIVSHQRLDLPAIRPESVTDPLVLEMIAKYRKNGIKFRITDFTLEMGIPSVGMLAWDPATFPEKSELVWTAGTTPDPQKALSRTMTEVAQLAGDFNSGSNYVASGLPKFTQLEDADFILNPSQTIDISELPDLSDNNIRVEVENCIEALDQRGMEVLVIDTMHPQLRIPAFYTIVPGAHFRERSLGTSVGMFASKLVLEKFSPPEAMARLNEIDKKLPGKYYVQFYLGSTHLEMGDPETALAHFKQALDLDPNEQEIPSIYSYMGVCLKDLGLYQEALQVLKKGEALDPERTDIYNLMGFCHFMLKEHERAIENFKRVLALDPGSAIDYANIASNYRDLGRKDKAIEYYHLALAIDPGIEFAKDNLERLLAN
jgi:ribosomal protein S12 methylthiotransferase accessory factor